MNTKSIIKFKKYLMPFTMSVLFFATNAALAADSQALVDIVGRVEGNVLSIARLLILISYVAGVGFAMAGVLQFKAHKDNPTQVPLSKPMVLICVAGALLFLPSLMSTAGKSIFGGTTAATPTVDITQVKTDSGKQ